MAKKLIIDGDFGGDEGQLMIMMANADQYEVAGLTCVFGNTKHEGVVKNALHLRQMIGKEDWQVFEGAKQKIEGGAAHEDSAHALDGIGNVHLDRYFPQAGNAQYNDSAQQRILNIVELKTTFANNPQILSALEKIRNNVSFQNASVEHIINTIKNLPEGEKLTITASGPLTNIALAYLLEPELMKAKVDELVIMGGSTADLQAEDVQNSDGTKGTRRGNISVNSEFNFYNSAIESQIVLNSGMNVVLLPMNATHQLELTNERQKQIYDYFMGLTPPRPDLVQVFIGNCSDEGHNVDAEMVGFEPLGAKFDKNILRYRSQDVLLGMMTAPAFFERTKFGIFPVMHDVNCAHYLLSPEQYNTQKAAVDVTMENEAEFAARKAKNPSLSNFRDELNGMTTIIAENPQGREKITVATGIKDPQKLFDDFMNALRGLNIQNQMQYQEPLKNVYVPDTLVAASAAASQRKTNQEDITP